MSAQIIIKKLSLPVTIVLAIFFYALSQKHKKQIPIDPTAVDSITIEPNYNTDPRADAPKKLKTEQVKKLVDDWNNAEVKGIYKYEWKYLVKVYLGNDSVRSFWVNGSSAQEKTNETFNLGGKEYFVKLWNDVK